MNLVMKLFLLFLVSFLSFSVLFMISNLNRCNIHCNSDIS